MDGTINEIRNLNEENAGLITTQIIRQTAPSIDRKTSLHTAAIHKQKDTPKFRTISQFPVNEGQGALWRVL